MNPLKTLCFRIYQKSVFLAQTLLRFKVPETLEGEGALKKIPSLLKKQGKAKPLIISGSHPLKNGDMDKLTKPLEEAGINYVLFPEAKADSPFPVIEKAYSLYVCEHCDCLIAFGGGSAMDTAKAIGAKASRPSRSLSSFKGVLKVRKRIPYLIAIPTTAGSGSEATLAAVVMNPSNHDKFAINDPVLIPSLAVLDPSLLASLPKPLIASTGMDALTHAVESYIGRARSRLSKKTALEAMALIKDNLVRFYESPSSPESALAMQKAAYLAGVSFTRGYVGYVHALAHSLGGYYGVPHGLANAVLLPFVLSSYGKKAHRKLNDAAISLGLAEKGSPKKEGAERFISWVKRLNEKLAIPSSFSGVIIDADLNKLASHAEKEANPLYPVPKEMNADELKEILLEVKD